jgi:hypothetical protein
MVTNLETEKRDVQTRKGVTALGGVIVVVAVVGLVVGVLLFVHINDVRSVDERVRTRVGQTEQAFCALLGQQSVNRDTVGERELSDQATVLMRKFNCVAKDSLSP